MADKALLSKLSQWKYPLLLLAVGVLLLAFPTGKKAEESVSPDSELERVLSAAEGVGEAQVLISEHGVVVVCEGALNASVKMDIIRAVYSYTGFGSDKITILRLTDHEKGRNGS